MNINKKKKGIGKTRLVQAFANMPEMTDAGTEDILFDDYAIQETRVSMNNDQQQQQKNICLVDTPGYGACVDVSMIYDILMYISSMLNSYLTFKYIKFLIDYLVQPNPTIKN